MKQFTNLTPGIICLAMVATSIGCGGSTSSTNQGSLAGNWVENPLSAHNTRLTINSNGTVTGQSLNFTLGGTDVLSGTLRNDGTFIGQITNDTIKTYTYGVIGTIKLDGSANQIRTVYNGSFSGAHLSTDVVMIRN